MNTTRKTTILDLEEDISPWKEKIVYFVLKMLGYGKYDFMLIRIIESEEED